MALFPMQARNISSHRQQNLIWRLQLFSTNDSDSIAEYKLNIKTSSDSEAKLNKTFDSLIFIIFLMLIRNAIWISHQE